jgi:hypothetical protein
MAFVGVGGRDRGIINLTLRVNVGDVVQVTLVNNDGIGHDAVFPDFKATTDCVAGKGASSVRSFGPTRPASTRTSARCPATARPGW